MRIWRYWFFWKYTVSHVIQYTLCCVGVFWMPITQKTDLFNLLWLYNSNIITSIYITSPTKQGVSSHYWWSRSIPGDSSRDLLIPQFEVPSNLQKGHLTIPKRSQRIARYIYNIYIYIMFFALNLEVSKLTKKTELPAIRSQLMSLCFNRYWGPTGTRTLPISNQNSKNSSEAYLNEDWDWLKSQKWLQGLGCQYLLCRERWVWWSKSLRLIRLSVLVVLVTHLSLYFYLIWFLLILCCKRRWWFFSIKTSLRNPTRPTASSLAHSIGSCCLASSLGSLVSDIRGFKFYNQFISFWGPTLLGAMPRRMAAW